MRASSDTIQARRPFSRRALLRGGSGAAGAMALAALGCRAGSKPAETGQAPAAATPTAAPYKLTTSWTGIAQEGALFTARDQGIFAKNGLDVGMTQITGATAIQTLIAGQIQIAGSGGGEALASMVAGSDVVVLVVQTPVFTGKLYVAPSIKSMDDLKGKKLGIALPGGTSDQTLRLALIKSGLQPDKDVTLVSTGSIQNQTAALLSGAIQGTNVTPGPESLKLDAAGFKPLVDFATMGLPPAAIVCISTRRAFISAHSDVVQRYVDSIVQGTVMFKRNKPLGLKELGSVLKSDDQAGLAASYDYTIQDTIMPSDPTPNPDLFKPFQDILCNSRGIAAACKADATQLVDQSFVASAVKRGLAK